MIKYYHVGILMTDPNKNSQNSDNIEFVEEVSQYISSDNITDLKSGSGWDQNCRSHLDSHKFS